MNTVIIVLNSIIWLIITVMYIHQYFYLIVGIFTRSIKREFYYNTEYKYAILIPGRNEELVVGNLIKSLQAQNYPKDKYDIFMIADNCTDKTANLARELGVFVIERFNKIKIGKGYALDYALNIIKNDPKYEIEKYKGFIIFDADNVVDKNFLLEINKEVNLGYDVVTSYRNSKNYGDNWLTAGSSLSYIRENRFMNMPKRKLNLNCAINGTGFFVSSDTLKDFNGWKFFLLTEDIEFTSDSFLSKKRIGYADKAILYDEQPTKISQVWKQRIRWAKGFIQVFDKNGIKLYKSSIRNRNFAQFDLATFVSPTSFFVVFVLFINLAGLIFSNVYHLDDLYTITSKNLFNFMLLSYVTFLIPAIFTTIFEWKRIKSTPFKKIFYTLTYPIFFLIYYPVTMYAAFSDNIVWKEIKHDKEIEIDDFK